MIHLTLASWLDPQDEMWKLSVPWLQLVLRAVIVYVFLLVLIRLTGKRQVGHLAPFDLILLLVLSNAVQNAMNGGDNSVTAGIVSALTLVVLNYGIGWATFKSKKIEALVEGRPVVLVHNGKVIHEAMNEVQMTTHELNAALRGAGCSCPAEVLVAVLENSGDVTVIAKKESGKDGGQGEPRGIPPKIG
jgi:uncharacterized membrane protein YcaP (DUF421 family)